MDWIKIGADLATKAEVVLIKRTLGVKRNEILGALVRLWTWADANTQDGFIAGATPDDVDEIVELPGLTDAMVQCGWLRLNPSGKPVGILFVNFERHMGESAKHRALHARAQEKYRNKKGKSGR